MLLHCRYLQQAAHLQVVPLKDFPPGLYSLFRPAPLRLRYSFIIDHHPFSTFLNHVSLPQPVCDCYGSRPCSELRALWYVYYILLMAS